VFTVGSDEVLVDGEKRTMDCKPVLQKVDGGDRMLIPLRFAGEAMKAFVHYDGKAKDCNS